MTRQAAAQHSADETEEVEIGSVALLESSTAMTAVDRAQIDVQVATAKAYPRSVSEALKEAISLATLDVDTAESMYYTLRRRDADGSTKLISGPSVRLAEVMAYSWKNLRVDADIVGEDATMITAMGTCFDIERNVAIRTRVKRRITTKSGKRYGDDMISTTANAALSIAMRNAVVRTIPRVFVDQIYNKARKAALGEEGTMSQKRVNALAWFKSQGASSAQVFALLNVKGIDDIGEEEYLNLRGLMNSLREGQTTVEQMFRSAEVEGAAADLNAKMNAPKVDAPAAPAAPAPLATGTAAGGGESEEDIRREEQELLRLEQERAQTSKRK